MVRRVPSYRHHKPSGKAVVTNAGRDYYLGNFTRANLKRRMTS
ncbi:MAG: hypothetical protein SFV81_17305 [Pirellulaceae bacterium]|nr:hypothetical protein [Pirellulaceae bacterium]